MCNIIFGLSTYARFPIAETYFVEETLQGKVETIAAL